MRREMDPILVKHKLLGVKGGPARATCKLLTMLTDLGILQTDIGNAAIAADAYTHRSICMNIDRSYYWSTYK